MVENGIIQNVCAFNRHQVKTLLFKNCLMYFLINDYFIIASMEYFVPAIDGACGGKCQSNVMLFIVLFACLVFIHSTSEVGSMLLIMRCTHPKDKAMAMGVIQFAIGLFGNIPCPIIYGIVVDSACMVSFLLIKIQNFVEY